MCMPLYSIHTKSGYHADSVNEKLLFFYICFYIYIYIYILFHTHDSTYINIIFGAAECLQQQRKISMVCSVAGKLARKRTYSNGDFFFLIYIHIFYYMSLSLSVVFFISCVYLMLCELQLGDCKIQQLLCIYFLFFGSIVYCFIIKGTFNDDFTKRKIEVKKTDFYNILTVS